MKQDVMSVCSLVAQAQGGKTSALCVLIAMAVGDNQFLSRCAADALERHFKIITL